MVLLPWFNEVLGIWMNFRLNFVGRLKLRSDPFRVLYEFCCLIFTTLNLLLVVSGNDKMLEIWMNLW